VVGVDTVFSLRLWENKSFACPSIFFSPCLFFSDREREGSDRDRSEFSLISYIYLHTYIGIYISNKKATRQLGEAAVVGGTSRLKK